MKCTTKLFLFLFLLLVSCSSGKRKNKSLYFYVFESDKILRITPYKLNIMDSDSILSYEYKPLSDSRKSIGLSYYPSKNEIAWYGGKLQMIDSVFNSSILDFLGDYEFRCYRQNRTDGTGPVLFDKEFGIVSLFNVLGPDFIILNDSNSKEKAMELRLQMLSWNKQLEF